MRDLLLLERRQIDAPDGSSTDEIDPVSRDGGRKRMNCLAVRELRQLSCFERRFEELSGSGPVRRENHSGAISQERTLEEIRRVIDGRVVGNLQISERRSDGL